MNQQPTRWSLDGFVEHFDFVHHRMLDHKFVWVLGAGASRASGIPVGSELVDRWLREMYIRQNSPEVSLENWATAENLKIPQFEYATRAAFYSKVYQRRFEEYPDEGFAYLESVMSGKDPSPGYSILASALALDPPRHNVVITTNFDNLVADALSIYTDSFPFVCGHESLTAFVRVSMRRPLVCKIHRDLLMGPQNDPRSLRRLHDAWGSALRALFQHYTPIFIGYGGNDDTLMDLLESLEPGDIKGQLVWCYYEGSSPSERIQNVVADHNGVLVPVPDFDLLMILLGERMQLALLDEEIDKRAARRTEQYRTRIRSLDTIAHPSVTKALAATFERSGGWWVWEQKAEAEKDPKRREAIYRQGLEHYPNSAQLLHNYGIFLRGLSRRDEALILFRRAAKLDPKQDVTLSIMAAMATEDGDLQAAEDIYKQAVAMLPDNYRILANYATYLWQEKRNSEEAEKMYNLAMTAAKKTNTDITAPTQTNYGQFLLSAGKLDEATKVLELAWQKLMKSSLCEGHAETAFARWLLARMTARAGVLELAILKWIISSSFKRSRWSFDAILAAANEKIPAEEQALAAKLAAAILNEGKVSNLARDPIWKTVTPEPLRLPASG